LVTSSWHPANEKVTLVAILVANPGIEDEERVHALDVFTTKK